MIVMKFGGTSLESAKAVQRVTNIVKAQLSEHPLLVVSAMGETTDTLLKLAHEAERGHSYEAWRKLKQLREFHSDIASAVSDGDNWQAVDQSIHLHFNQLHRLIVKIEDEGLELSPALQDEILSYGERLSSEIVTAALHGAGVPALHLDARQFIVTDDQFTHAAPLYWETYAKLRRIIPRLAETRTIVMGGFIAATESGVTSTLGRGGSDLTASLVGAAVCADEIQIWTDVDGMLTCDPKLVEGVYRIRSLTYREASAMAEAGAQVLHPDSVRPAVRQRIPIVIRNSRRPEVEGTRITASVESNTNPVKSIAAKQHLTVLEVRLRGDASSSLEELQQLCGRHGVAPELIGCSGTTVYLGIKSSDDFRSLRLDLKGCVEVRIHSECASLTLIGAKAPTSELATQVSDALTSPEAFLVPSRFSEQAITAVVPQRDLRRSAEALHRKFFAEVDSPLFAKIETQRPIESQEPAARTNAVPARKPGKSPRFVLAHR